VPSVKPSPTKRTRRLGRAWRGFRRRPSAAIRLDADTVFAGRSGSVSVNTNRRAPRAWYGAVTSPATMPSVFASAVSMRRPSTVTSTAAPGVKPSARTAITSRVFASTER
jgi:hypothetical protein